MNSKRHYIKIDISDRTYLAVCRCGWRSDCLTSPTAFNRVVAQHQELAKEERRYRSDLKHPRRIRRP